MKSNTFFRFFPPPAVLAPVPTGLDISDRSIKYASLRTDWRKISLARMGELELPPGLISGGMVSDKNSLVKLLAELRQAQHLNHVHISLPEDQAYTFHLHLPRLSPEEARASVKFQLAEYVPISADQSIFDCSLVPNRNPKLLDACVSVVPVVVAETYAEVLARAGFTVWSFETEARSAARSLVPATGDKYLLVVDIGRVHTRFFVVKGHEVFYASVVKDINGEVISGNIKRNLKIEFAEAEKKKMMIGLSRQQQNRELFSAILPVASALKDEIASRLSYWLNHDSQGRSNEPIEGLILCGGQSAMPGLLEYLESGVGLPIKVGNPWTNIMSFEQEVPDWPLSKALRYAGAIGVALRPLTHYL